jgi:translation initiation factor 1
MSSSKRKSGSSAIVYSTNPEYSLENKNQEDEITLPPGSQKLKIRLETKHRAGKAVTLIEGYSGTLSDKEEVVKKLKNHCGSGGSAKDGEMLVQGDQREKVFQWLIKNGYVLTKKL